MVIWVSPFCDGDHPARGTRAGRKGKCGGSARLPRGSRICACRSEAEGTGGPTPCDPHLGAKRRDPDVQLAPQPPSVLSCYERHGKVQAARIQRAGEMFRPRPIGMTAIRSFTLGFPVAGLAIRGVDTAGGLTAGLSVRMCRTRAARSMHCARPSDLHPDGRIAGLLARMRATPPAGSARRPPPGYAAQRGQRPRVPGGGRYGRNLRAR